MFNFDWLFPNIFSEIKLNEEKIKVDFDSDFAELGVTYPRAMSFDNIWSEPLCSYASPVSRTWPPPMGQAIPTPPLSPSIEPDEILGLDSTFSGMVNPNSILDETSHHRPGAETDHTLDAINLGIPLLEDLDIKIENYDYLMTNDFALSEPLCSHGFSSTFCNCCFDDTFKTEIVNDCMWGTVAPCDEKPTVVPTPSNAVAPLSTSSPAVKIESGSVVPSSRLRFDSTSSRYSDAVDPLSAAMPTIDADLHYSAPRLETPSESSDTDTDVDEGPHPAENVHLDHNYFSSSSSSSSSSSGSSSSHHKNDITRPLMKALHDISMAQTDSDDEIDVVSLGSQEPQFNRLTKFHGTFTVRDSKNEPSVGATVTVSGPAKRGRKPGSTGTRKVGRPCKNPKRLNAKGAKTVGRRCGPRSVAMDPHKRSLHNSMERMRRVDLKNCFDAVRCNVPALRDRTRAPKVLILKSAAELVKNLEKSEQRKRQEVERLQHYQRLLLMKLQRLKEDVAGTMEKEFG